MFDVWCLLLFNNNCNLNVDRTHSSKHHHQTSLHDDSHHHRHNTQLLHRKLIHSLLPVQFPGQLLLHSNSPLIKPIQIIVTGFIFIMVLVLLWQTFPLRYGLLSTLIREFKWTFIILIVFLGKFVPTKESLLWREDRDWLSPSLRILVLMTLRFGTILSTLSPTIWGNHNNS